MERCDAEAFRESPAGRFRAASTWAHFAAHPGLFGVVLFGRPDRSAVAALVESLRIELDPRTLPHRSIVDASRLEGADEGAFDELARYVRDNHAALAVRVERLVLVRPRGIEGAVVAGFFGVLEAPYPVTLATDVRSGLAALGEPEGLADALEAMVLAATDTDPSVGALHDYLRAHLLEATMEGACKALGLSDRTLQRRLGEVGTSFRGELLATRLREAERRLLATSDSLTAVALDSGFSSLSHFSSKFHEAHGLSPSAWRERAGRGGK